ncbi:MAG: metal-binding protein [Candidatus Eremiobacteraeota bacterium]|nr:metal-binding protein [Candidatus Eremiobacteraeota bacterium]
MDRRTFLAAGAAAGLLGAAPRKRHVVTYRDRGCGCCEGWVAAARTAGYSVEMHDLERTERTRRFGLTDATAGCHTSLAGGYVVEGHVPLDVVARLLRERPRIRGIAAPGMPMGVPGMEGPRIGPLDIITLEPHSRLYARV